MVNSYVAWNWLANGAGAANTDGTISSTVSANTTSGFSIVSCTGTGMQCNYWSWVRCLLQNDYSKNRDEKWKWIVYHECN
jgi:hypothetical protein